MQDFIFELFKLHQASFEQKPKNDRTMYRNGELWSGHDQEDSRYAPKSSTDPPPELYLWY